MQRVAIAVAGATGSGKSTLAHAVARALGGTVLHTDDYYRPLDHLTFAERCFVNFDHPDAVDHAALSRDLRRLLDGRAIDGPQYDFSRHTRSVRRRIVQPAPVVVVEGVFALAYPAVADQCDVRIAVETVEAECLRRRIQRDVTERGRTPEEVIQRFTQHVAPMFREFTLPTLNRAHLRVSGERDLAANVDRVAAFARSRTGTEALIAV